jgi:hypothetical protein
LTQFYHEKTDLYEQGGPKPPHTLVRSIARSFAKDLNSGRIRSRHFHGPLDLDFVARTLGISSVHGSVRKYSCGLSLTRW